MHREAVMRIFVAFTPFALFVLLLCSTAYAQSATVAEAAAEGRAVADHYLGSLKKELVRAISENGPVHAMDVCSTKVRPITEAATGAFANVVELKRTSLRYRNPDNAPTKEEQDVLERFEKLLARGTELPPFYLQSRGDRFEFYKPLFVEAPCLACHGPKQGLSTEVRDRLRAMYPHDRAIGYRPGDLRGVLRVSLRKTADK